MRLDAEQEMDLDDAGAFSMDVADEGGERTGSSSGQRQAQQQEHERRVLEEKRRQVEAELQRLET